MLLDGMEAQVFVIDMGTSVQNLTVRNIIPGQLYVFLLVQNAAGGHSFNWGNTITNGATINPAPHSTTSQACIGRPGGLMQAITAGTWTEAP